MFARYVATAGYNNNSGGVYIIDGLDYADLSGDIEDIATFIDADSRNNYFGGMSSWLGDQNDDGFDDLFAIGTDGSGNPDYAAGLFFGSAGGIAAGELADADVLFQQSYDDEERVKALSHVDLY